MGTGGLLVRKAKGALDGLGVTVTAAAIALCGLAPLVEAMAAAAAASGVAATPTTVSVCVASSANVPTAIIQLPWAAALELVKPAWSAGMKIKMWAAGERAGVFYACDSAYLSRLLLMRIAP